MRKRLLFTLGPLALVLLGGYALLWWTAPRVSRANFGRIEVGMTLAEVEALLGPPGMYATGPLVDREGQRPFSVFIDYGPRPGGARKLWVGDHGAVWVNLDDAGRVAGTQVLGLRREAEPPLVKLRRWLGIAP